MRKAADAFRSIGEVSQLVGVPPHVLRYWETQFSQLAPVKRADGRRYYRPEDLHLAAGICELLREEGMTTRGAARVIARDKGAEVRARGRARLPERFHEGAEASAATAKGAALANQTEVINAMGGVTAQAGTMVAAEASGTPVLPDANDAHAAPLRMEDAGDPAITANEPEGTASATRLESQADDGASDAEPEEPTAVNDPSSESGSTSAASVDAESPGASSDAQNSAEGIASPRPTREAKPVNGAADKPPKSNDPESDDLPLFPGLAHAAPPPGIWLPRLAAMAAVLREMPPPRRPTARMQQLRDRLAALLDIDH